MMTVPTCTHDALEMQKAKYQGYLCCCTWKQSAWKALDPAVQVTADAAVCAAVCAAGIDILS
jgi:hypothetical protein